MRNNLQKPRHSMVQRDRFMRLLVVLLLVALLWLLFAPGAGFFAWWGKRGEVNRLEQETVLLEAANKHLQEEIDRVQNDPVHLEDLARKEYNLLRKNEQVFDFSGGGSTEQEQ